MKLIPKAKPVRIRILSGGIEHSSLDSLLQNFDIDALLPLYKNGSLVRWLNQIGATDVVNKLGTLKITDFSSLTDSECAGFIGAFISDVGKFAQDIAHYYESYDDGDKIVRWHKIAYNAGNFGSAYELGLIYDKGLYGIARSANNAIKYYKDAADVGIIESQIDLALLYYNGDEFESESSVKKAIRLLEPIAPKSPRASFELARIYYFQWQVLMDNDKSNLNIAIKYFKDAANKGYIDAYTALADTYFLLKRYDDAEKYYEKAISTKGVEFDADDYENYAIILYRKNNNNPKVAKYYMLAIDLGSDYAKNRLGQLYEDGEGGLEKDDNKAIFWYEEAAKNNFKDAFWNLGLHYFNCGDNSNAIPWLKEAINHGYSEAKELVAKCYLDEGIQHQKAYNLFKESAENGSDYAQYFMGYIYENGLTVVGKNKNKAIEWYRKSADNGNKYATEKLRKFQA